MHQPAALTGSDGLRDLRGAQRCRQTHVPAGQCLADAHDVGTDAGVIGGEQFSGASESGRDFVEDQEDLVLVAEVTQVDQVRGIMETHSAGTLDHWFHDHRCEVLVMLGQERFQLLHVFGEIARRGSLREDLRAQDIGPERMHAAVGIADAHGGEGVTVVSAAPGHQTILRRLSEAPPVLQAHLHCDFDGHRTGVGEEHLVEVRWCVVDEQSPEASGGFVCQSAEHDMAHLAELPCGGGVEHGIAVAVNGGPPRAHPVDQSATVGERQGSPLRRVDDQRTSRRGKRSVRMPEDIGIDGGDVMGIKSGCEHGCTLTIELNGVQVWSEK